MLFYALLSIWQIVDIAIHFANDQIEPLRILASVLILLAATTAGQLASLRSPILLGAGFAYLALNLVFLAQHGLINPETETLRLPLFVFVLVSLVLLWLIGRRAPE